ncbi:MAG: FhaA domain-containing protein [Acidimicrobiales bacterium]
MVLRSVEKRLERLVDGAFARAFRTGVRPVELGRRLVREMDHSRSVGVKGRPVAPNDFSFALSPEDDARLAEIREVLVRELCDAAREHAREEGYSFMGPVRVQVAADPRVRPGAFELACRLSAGEGGRGAGSLVLASGERIGLGEGPVVIGRLPECQVQLSDPNVSRRHVEIRPAGPGFMVVDLGSTNGTKVNGVRVDQRQLRDGDQIVVGATTLTFEAS